MRNRPRLVLRWRPLAAAAALALACAWPLASLGQDGHRPPPPPDRQDAPPPPPPNDRDAWRSAAQERDDGARGQERPPRDDNWRRQRGYDRQGQRDWDDDAWVDDLIRRAIASGRMPLPIDGDDPDAVARWLVGLRDSRELLERKREELRRLGDPLERADMPEAHRLAERIARADQDLRQDGFAAIVHAEKLQATLRNALAADDLSPERRAKLQKGAEVADLVANRPELLRELRREVRARHQRSAWNGRGAPPWNRNFDPDDGRFRAPDGPPFPGPEGRAPNGFPPGDPQRGAPENGYHRPPPFGDGWADGPPPTRDDWLFDYEAPGQGSVDEAQDDAARALRREGVRARLARASSESVDVERLEREVASLREEVAALRSELRAIAEAMRAQQAAAAADR